MSDVKKEIEEENLEAVVTAGNVKVRNGGKLRKILATGVVVLAISISGTLVYLNIDNKTPNFDEQAIAVVDMVSDSSVIDEVIQIVNSNVLTNLDNLEATVTLSETLHKLNLNNYIGGLTKLSIPETYNIEGIEDMVDRFKELVNNKKVQNNVLSEEDREFTQLALTLEAYERKVNGLLTNQAYQTLVDFGIPLVKSKVLDACGFDAEEVSQMKIGSGSNSYVISFIDSETGKNYNLSVNKGNSFSSIGYVHEVISQIYDWQNKSQQAQDTGTAYDGNRNSDIISGINALKTLTLMECEITDNAEVKVTTKMSEVKENQKTKTIINTTSGK